MKKKILIIKHVENEGPGSIGIFPHYCLGTAYRRVIQGERLNHDLGQIAAVVVMVAR